MDLLTQPGGRVEGETSVPGDKSIAHRWLILAATAQGESLLEGLPGSLDVGSMASCLASVTVRARPSLEAWARHDALTAEGNGSTWNAAAGSSTYPELKVEGDGRFGLVAPDRDLDCGNSGATMRLLAGVLAAAPFGSVLTGDRSLSSRPMERVAAPLRLMGASVGLNDGRPPLRIEGAQLHGIHHRTLSPSAQVKGAILLAGIAAAGRTEVEEPLRTRDHTERALLALGAPVEIRGTSVGVLSFQHGGFSARVPGDVSSTAFLVAAAALTRGSVTIRSVGLNPTRLAFIDVMARMGVRIEPTILGEQLGEPFGDLWVGPCEQILPVRVGEEELPLVIDEVPALAALAAHAGGDSWFMGAGELRAKETDRLATLSAAISGLGGHAAVEGSDLVLAGGGIQGGVAVSAGDHRIAMAAAVAALAAQEPCRIGGIECAEVSFPGFASTLRALGARVEVS